MSRPADLSAAGSATGGTRADGTASESLSDHIAGESVIRELLRVQSVEGERSRIARSFGRSPVGPEMLPWYRGALGEQAVGRILERLGADWHVLHAIGVGEGASDIDHLVIGPGGVISINTKNHAEKQVWVAGTTFMVSGQRQPYLRNSEFEARRVTTALSASLPVGFEVTPVIAVLDPAALTVREAPERVVVLEARKLATWISARPTILDDSQIQTILAAASRPETWRESSSLPAKGDSSSLLAAFEGLTREVRQARRRRLAWVSGTAAAVLAACALLAPSLTTLLDSVLVR